MDVIITPEEVGALSRPISQHVDHSLLQAYIDEVVQLNIRPTMGALFARLRDYPTMLVGGVDKDGCEVAGGVKKAAAYFVYAKVIKQGATIATRFGAVEKTDEYSVRIEQERKDAIARECTATADAYMQEVLTYAKAKGLIGCCGGVEVPQRRRTTYVVGE